MKSFDDMVAMLSVMPEAERKAIEEKVSKETAGMKFIPSPGKQSEAWFSKADVLLYGGSGGAGKTGLIIGLALTDHERSLIIRKHGVDLGAITEETIKFNGTRDGFNGSSPPKLRTTDGKLIEFGAAERFEQWQGQAHDFLGIDEAAQLMEHQVRFLMGWVRSTTPGQRKRVVLATNPPMTAEGDWLIKMFAPWLDITHHNPAKPGELRWFVTDKNGNDLEVDNGDPYPLDGKILTPASRTFIPATVDDNPYLADTGYKAQLDSLPEPYRSSVRDGNFMASRKDDEWQVIPTDWIRQAIARWAPQAPDGVPMCAIGVDVAQGGNDSTVLAIRHDGWYAPIIKVVGSLTPSGAEVAGLVVANRRDSATVIVDVGGGYGGAAIEHLKINKIKIARYNGAEASHARTKDKTLKFRNKRAEAYWKFREALDPSQPGGSHIALPDDPELVADLTSVKIKQEEITASGIQLESKKDIKARIGRSPDKGDAVIMAYSDGDKISTILSGDWNNHGARHRPQVNLGHQNIKRRR